MIKIFACQYIKQSLNEDLNKAENINYGSSSHIYPLDNELIYSSDDDEYSLSSLKLTTELNSSGILEFDAPYDSHFSEIYPPKIEEYGVEDTFSLSEGWKSSTLYVYQNDHLIWKGVLVDREVDLYGNQHLVYRDEFFIMQNLVVDLSEVKKKLDENGEITIKNFYEALMKSGFKDGSGGFEREDGFHLGSDFIFNYTSSLPDDQEKFKPDFNENDSEICYLGEALKKYLLDNFGGYIIIERKENVTFFNYRTSETILKNDSQIIDSSNILNLEIKMSISSSYNGLYGVRINQDGDKDYNYTSDSRYFFRGLSFFKIQNFDYNDKYNYFPKQVSEYFGKNLKGSFPEMSIEINAIDMSLLDNTLKPIKEGELIFVSSPNHNLNDYLICTKIEKDFLQPQNTKYYIGVTSKNISETKDDYTKKFDYSINFTSSNVSRINTRLTNLGG